MDKDNLDLGSRVQVIYYMKDDELGITYATYPRRIKFAEAEQLLKDRSLEYDKILKIESEFIRFTISLETFEKNIKQ